MAAGWRSVEDRPLYLQPLKSNPGLTILLCQRVVPARRARSEEPNGIGPDCFALEEVHVQLSRRRFGAEVETAQLAQLLRWKRAVQRDRLGRPACGDYFLGRKPPRPRPLPRPPESVSARPRRLSV